MADPHPLEQASGRLTRSLRGSTWFAPALLALVFMGLLGGLLWLLQMRNFQAEQTALESSIRTAQESIRLRLHSTRDHLMTLAEDMARDSITQDIFTQRLAHFMGEHPELVSAMYVDAEGTARWAVPAQWEEKVLGRPLACPRSLEISREAKQTQRPVYSDVHMSLQNEPAFDLSIPIYRNGTFQGSIVGVYSCDRMLRNMLSREIVTNHRASIIDAKGNTILALPTAARLDERLGAVAALDPPGQGVALRLDRYGSGFWGLGLALLVVLCMGLAIGMSWSMWSLKRQIARRVEVQQQLRDANNTLTSRVRERTADLEATNQKLQQEIHERQLAQEESRRRQGELAHVTRVSTMGEMATGLAHELNQPLGAISGFAEGSLRLLESGKSTPDSLRMSLTEVADQARRAGQIIKRLRSLVARGEPRRDAHDLAILVADLVELIAPETRQEQVDLRVKLPPGLPKVLVDGIQTQQVLLNLVRNAIEALRQVEVARREITVQAVAEPAGWVTVSVTDRGPGCPADLVERMFEAFFSTKDAGLGMGLSISRSIVEAHGGRIWAQNGATSGMAIFFTLPTVEGAGNV